MATVEFVEGDGVPVRAEAGREATAAEIDGQDAVARPVRDEDTGATLDRGRDDESRRERKDRREHVAVGDPKGQRIGRPVRDPPTAKRSKSTSQLSATRLSTRSAKATSGPNSRLAMMSQVSSRESGAATTVP